MSFFKKMKDILFDEEESTDVKKVQPKIEEPKEIPIEKPVKESPSFNFPEFNEDFTNDIFLTDTYFEEEVKTKREIKETFKDHSRYEKVEVVEKKKFTPSLIISPVYGVLNKDYSPDDIKQKDNIEKLDVDEVRKKAFETQELPKVKEIKKEEIPTSKPIEKKEPEKIVEKEPKTIEELINSEDDYDNPDTLENDLFDLIDSMYEKKEGV